MNDFDKYDVAIGKIIKKRRIELNVTQEKMSKKFNIDRSTLAHYESGRRSMNASLFFQICDYLFLDADKVAKEIMEEYDKV